MRLMQRQRLRKRLLKRNSKRLKIRLQQLKQRQRLLKTRLLLRKRLVKMLKILLVLLLKRLQRKGLNRWTEKWKSAERNSMKWMRPLVRKRKNSYVFLRRLRASISPLLELLLEALSPSQLRRALLKSQWAILLNSMKAEVLGSKTTKVA